MGRTYTIGKDGVMYIWAWKTDILTSEYKSQMGFSGFKRGKKLKTGNEMSENTTVVMADELGLENDGEDQENLAMSYHEKHF